MGKKLEIPIGTRFGHLVIVKEIEKKDSKKRRFLCKCDCGNDHEVNLADLVHGNIKSCGCGNWIKPKTNIDEYIGKKYGMLTIIGDAGYSEDRHVQVKCQCDCGEIVVKKLTYLKCGDVLSCGCKRYTHDGITSRWKERLYRIWSNMKNRCNNPNECGYKNYGGRGITYCNEWETYPPFRTWALENGYSDDLTIDRINVNGNYEPSNCRWVNMKTQSNNTRRNIYVTYNGETHTMAEWSEITGIKLSNLYTRYHRGFALDVVFSKKRLASRGKYEKRKETEVKNEYA